MPNSTNTMEPSLQEKMDILGALNTKNLLSQLWLNHEALESISKQDAQYRSENVRFLASYGDDCTEVKAILADLALEPPVDAEGKKLTVNKLDAWIRQQRINNPALAKAIETQNKVTFQCENNRINLEMAKKRLESLKAVISLRTAQIEFLA